MSRLTSGAIFVFLLAAVAVSSQEPPAVTNLRVTGQVKVFGGSRLLIQRGHNGSGYDRLHVYELAEPESAGENVEKTDEIVARNFGDVRGDRVFFSAKEARTGEDLNGDGDVEDCVLGVYETRSGETVLTGLTSSCGEPREGHDFFRLGDRILTGIVPEFRQGDLNQDGDAEDRVLHFYDFERRETVNLGLAIAIFNCANCWPSSLSHYEDTLFVRVPERDQGQDLNRDGDTEDLVLHVHHLASRETVSLELATDRRPWPLPDRGLGCAVSTCE